MLVRKVVTNRRKSSHKPVFGQKKKESRLRVIPLLSSASIGGASRDRTDDLLTASQALIPAEL